MLLHSQIIGAGRPLVILHGFLGMGDNWRTLGNQFAQLGFQVHLVDARNHGRSFHSEYFSYPFMVSDLADYCGYHNLEQIFLLGHSMGGKTAMFFAVKFPELVSKLIIADVSPKAYPQHHQIILKGLSSLDFSKIKTRQAAQNVLSKYIKDLPTLQFLLKNVYWKSKDELALRIYLPALIKNIDEIGKALAANTTYGGEVLFLKGEHSEYIKTEDEQLLKSHFPRSIIRTVSNAGHWLHSENSSEFYEYVKEFL